MPFADLEKKRAQQREYMRKYLAKKRAESPEYRAKQSERQKKRYAKLSADPEWKKKQNAKRNERFKARYSSDPEWREKLSEQGRAARARAGQSGRRGYRLPRDYGLPLEAFDAMHRAQGGACAICGRLDDAWPHVDHEHVTGYGKMSAEQKASYVRGLLCRDCNSGLGRFGDDPTRLRAAADYLEAARKKQKPKG